MKTISLKIDEATYKELNIRRGRKTISEFLREVIDAHISGAYKPLGDDKSLRALAIYLTEVMRITNPPAFANNGDKIKNLFTKFVESISEGGGK